MSSKTSFFFSSQITFKSAFLSRVTFKSKDAFTCTKKDILRGSYESRINKRLDHVSRGNNDPNHVCDMCVLDHVSVVDRFQGCRDDRNTKQKKSASA